MYECGYVCSDMNASLAACIWFTTVHSIAICSFMSSLLPFGRHNLYFTTWMAQTKQTTLRYI